MNKTSNKTLNKKEKNSFIKGFVFVHATFNNTIVTITNLNGNTISWSSAGSNGFKGARKSTPFAAQTAAENAAFKAVNQGLKNVEILIKGPGSGKDTIIRAIKKAGLEILSIEDITPISHNGCRARKRRRV